MPQLAPASALILFVGYILSIIFMFIILYYTFTPQPPIKAVQSPYKPTEYLWKW